MESVTVFVEIHPYRHDVEAEARVFYEGDEPEPTVEWLSVRDRGSLWPAEEVRQLFWSGWEENAIEAAKGEGLSR